MPEEQSVSGRVKSIFFQNPTNFYKILLLEITATNLVWPESEIVVTGNFGDIKEDETYVFTGKLINHPKYGEQFAADNYHSERPTSKAGLVNYLSSDKFPGIGPKTAQKIVDQLGVTAIDKIVKDPKTLVPTGLSPAKRDMLVNNLKANLGMEQVIIGLNEYGITGAIAAKLYTLYADDTLNVIEENPYQLIADVDGIGFRRADQIAAKLNIAADSPQRLGGAVLAVLGELTDGEGDTYVDLPRLLDGAIGLLEGARNVEVSPKQVGAAVVQLAHDHAVVAEDQRVYPAKLYDAEWAIAKRLQMLIREKPDLIPEAKLRAAMTKTAAGITYDETQQTAILTALQQSVFVLTGGPGTGKTTVVNGIVRTYAELNDLSLDINQYDEDHPFPIMLAAPTGRAAKRMADTTGLPASTIHRLLGLAVDGTDFEPRDLPTGLLIVDEMSMVDTYLFRILLSALHPGIRLILVGDKDQLPSVGPGQVFADLLRAGVLPAQELTHIHRQDAKSSIIPLAHAINSGQLPADWQQPKPDRSFILCPPNQLATVVGQVAAKAGKKFGLDNMQVLAPMYRGVAGIDQLNPLLQQILNPKKTDRTKEVEFNDRVYRIGDKVLQLVNNPEQNVFNGEIGIIRGITDAKHADTKTDELTIDFDGNELTYPRRDWSKFTLAYATSIHKAQGSEFSLVILPLTLASRRMLRRNLLYTAVTRAKDFLILLGDPRAFNLAVQEVADNRHTSLVARLQTTLPHSPGALPQQSASDQVKEPAPAAAPPSGPVQLTPALVAANSIDPMIGMSGITPHQFMQGENHG
ncbi:SF1B family DNA helicase RecD2 [Lacticaseibacillus nasuensis]|uniref:SF1B family DNA helicase RecD2 n=1 Tax=Lacticaseibacillus nasuensis TaxID=944671 RepID=UPI0022472C59|nr:ATP-dependent RecD-like DNA helicase [Lacticaseibacillus nasuensis]MCX2456109.1 ATP-dependent RecD-like DNA helicase [Lacticaseibacillus nasuensis]